VSSSVNGTDEQRLAERVVRRMLERDAFSAWLALELLEVRPRYAAVRMVVRPDMMNGFGVCHGGVTFALADSAFAFASNTHGRVTVSIDNSITYPAAVSTGDVLTAVATEESEASRLAFYGVRVTNQHGGVVALFRGTVYRTNRGHFPDEGEP
jgi:acyl-CoA thioesterase